MRRVLLVASTFACFALVGCKQDPAAEGGACSKQTDCLDGLSCVEGICQRMSEATTPEPTGYCATLAAMAGSWTFDTTVVGAEDLAPRGINGHFQMTVTVDNCEGKIELTKSGYDDVEFTKAKVQRSDAALSESSEVPTAAVATVSLKNGKPSHTMTFMVRDGQLFGYYSYAESEWRRAGIWGFLRGVELGQDLAKIEDFATQPCEVRCLTQCDTTRRRADGTLDEASLGVCMTACGAGEAVVGCGAGADLPEELVVALDGPVKTRDALCAAAGKALLERGGHDSGGPAVECVDEPEIKGKPTARKLSKARLKGSFRAVELLELGYLDGGYAGELILALETDAGWYWTEQLVDMSVSGVGGVAISTDGVKLQARDMLSLPGREVVLELRTTITDSDLGVNEVSIDETKQLVVCSTGAPPTCVQTNLRWSSDRTLVEPKGDDPAKHPDLRSESGVIHVAILPDDRLSISTPPEARPDDRALAGIYAWPSP